MPDLEFETWPATLATQENVYTPWWIPIDFLGGQQAVPMNREFTDSKGNLWSNTAGLAVTGEPIENIMTLEIYSSQVNTANAEMYSNVADQDHKMPGVRGLYFESSTNAYDTNPMLQSVAIMYKNAKTGKGAAVYDPLIYRRDQYVDKRYSLDTYKLSDIDAEGTNWVPQRWVIADPEGKWADPDWVWIGCAFNMKVWNSPGSATKGQCKVRKLRPIVDVGNDPEAVAISDNRVIWGHFTL